MVDVHSATDRPIGLPTMRSLAKPKGAAHHAGHGSERSNRHAIRTRKPKSGYQPLVVTIGSADSIAAAMTEAAGMNGAAVRGPCPMRRPELSAARTIRAFPS